MTLYEPACSFDRLCHDLYVYTECNNQGDFSLWINRDFNLSLFVDSFTSVEEVLKGAWHILYGFDAASTMIAETYIVLMLMFKLLQKYTPKGCLNCYNLLIQQ